MAFSYKDYLESEEVRRKREEAERASVYTPSSDVAQYKNAYDSVNASKPASWGGGQYASQIADIINQINNRKKFTYDLNADVLYNQYKDQYMSAGKTAMADTVARASALTGGYANSYAATAGSQAYQASLARMNDIVPELYNAAYARYAQEGQDLKDRYSLMSNENNLEYQRYRDAVADWENERNMAYNVYSDTASRDQSRYLSERQLAQNAYESARNYDYSVYSDAYSNALKNYQQSVAEDQYNRNLAEEQRQYNETLELNKAKLLEDQRQFNATMDYKKDKLSESQTKEQTAKHYTEAEKKSLISNIETMISYGTTSDAIGEMLLGMVRSGELTQNESETIYNMFFGTKESDESAYTPYTPGGSAITNAWRRAKIGLQAAIGALKK